MDGLLRAAAYWEIGNKAADYATLIRWWNQHAANRPLYIGEDVERTVKYADPTNPNRHQQAAKQKLHQELRNIDGTVLCNASAVFTSTGSMKGNLSTGTLKTDDGAVFEGKLNMLPPKKAAAKPAERKQEPAEEPQPVHSDIGSMTLQEAFAKEKPAE